MTEFLLWLPAGIVGIVILVLLAVVRFPDEVDEPSPAAGPASIGAVRVATVSRGEKGVVVDGLVARLSSLGSAGSPIAIVLSDAGTDDEAYRRLEGWAARDAVVEIATPAVDRDGGRVVGLRSGDDEVRLPILALSS